MSLDAQYLWWIERGKLALAYYNPSVSSVDDLFTSPDTAGKEIRFFYVKKDAAFNTGASIDLTESSSVPGQFHEVLVNRAIALGYERSQETLQMAKLFYAKYMEGIKEAKKFAYREYVSGGRRISPVDF